MDVNKSNEEIKKNKKKLFEKNTNNLEKNTNNLEKFQLDRKNSINYNNTINPNEQNLFYENFLDRSQILKNQISRQKAQNNFNRNNTNINSTIQNEGDYTDNTDEYLFLQTHVDNFSHQKNNSIEISKQKKKQSKILL